MHLLARIGARHHGPNTEVKKICIIAWLSAPRLRCEEIKAGIRVIRGAGRIAVLTGLVNNPEFVHVMLTAWSVAGVNFIRTS